MTKRLKKRILEVCGFSNLSKEERAYKVEEILNSVEEKQAICNQVTGASFKDIKKALVAFRNEKTRLTEDEKLAIEVPEKIYPEKTYSREVRSSNLVEILDPNEASYLIEQIRQSIAEAPLDKVPDTSYETYSFEEVAALIANNYHPSMFKRRRK